MKLGTNIHRGEWALLKVTGSKVKVTCIQACECYSSGGIDFDSAASRLSCSVMCLASINLDTDVGVVLNQE